MNQESTYAKEGSVAVAEVYAMVMNNRVADLASVMESFGLRKSTPPRLDTSNLRLTQAALTAAVAAANCGRMNDKMANELVERTAMAVDTFDFAHIVVEAANYDGNTGNVPTILSLLLHMGWYNQQVSNLIKSLSEPALLGLLSMLTTDAITQADAKINLPIIRRIYGSGILPKPVLFSMMALSLREPELMLNLASDPMSQMLASILFSNTMGNSRTSDESNDSLDSPEDSDSEGDAELAKILDAIGVSGAQVLGVMSVRKRNMNSSESPRDTSAANDAPPREPENNSADGNTSQGPTRRLFFGRR